jgi:hypothetical protein
MIISQPESKQVIQTKMNHKWKSTSNQFNPKRGTCINCGIERNWIGGNMQGWEYVDFRLPFHRPICTPKLPKGITQFSRKGIYI